MTFIDSLLNNKDDIDIQYQNEAKLWSSYKQIKDFNQRKCNCCNCNIDPDDYDEQNQNCGKPGSKYVCFNEYYQEEYQEKYDEENGICQCSCIYSIVNDPLILSNSDMLKIITYLKTKNIGVTYRDLDIENNNTQNTEWNSMLIDICNITNEDIKSMLQEMAQDKLKCYAQTFNVLRIMDGMSNLRYST